MEENRSTEFYFKLKSLLNSSNLSLFDKIGILELIKQETFKEVFDPQLLDFEDIPQEDERISSNAEGYYREDGNDNSLDAESDLSDVESDLNQSDDLEGEDSEAIPPIISSDAPEQEAVKSNTQLPVSASPQNTSKEDTQISPSNISRESSDRKEEGGTTLDPQTVPDVPVQPVVQTSSPQLKTIPLPEAPKEPIKVVDDGSNCSCKGRCMCHKTKVKGLCTCKPIE